MKSFIIGITGCAGSHLADYLFDEGIEVFGAKRETSSLNNILHIIHRIKMMNINLCDKRSITNVLEEYHPDHIYFLVSAKPFDPINSIYHTNVEETVLFFETLAELSFRPRVVLVSGSAVYGIHDGISPIKEDSALFPSAHYGLSKLFQEEVAQYYVRNHDMNVVIARPFNHPGPREHLGLVCSDFAKQIADIEKGKGEPVIKVGNLENKRDFTDVRDIIKGYVLLAEKGRKGETYNLCSGKAFSIKSVLDRLISLSTSKINIEVDPKRVKPAEVKVQLGDHSKIFSEIRWEPKIPLEKTLEDILNDYRERVI